MDNHFFGFPNGVGNFSDMLNMNAGNNANYADIVNRQREGNNQQQQRHNFFQANFTDVAQRNQEDQYNNIRQEEANFAGLAKRNREDQYLQQEEANFAQLVQRNQREQYLQQEEANFAQLFQRKQREETNFAQLVQRNQGDQYLQQEEANFADLVQRNQREETNFAELAQRNNRQQLSQNDETNFAELFQRNQREETNFAELAQRNHREQYPQNQENNFAELVQRNQREQYLQKEENNFAELAQRNQREQYPRKEENNFAELVQRNQREQYLQNEEKNFAELAQQNQGEQHLQKEENNFADLAQQNQREQYLQKEKNNFAEDTQQNQGEQYLEQEGEARGVDESPNDLASMSHQELAEFASNLIITFSHGELLQVVQYMVRTKDGLPSLDNDQRKPTNVNDDKKKSVSRSSSKKTSNDSKAATSAKKTEESVGQEEPSKPKQAEDSWEYYFSKLTEYKEKHGDCNCKVGTLYRWMNSQRKLYDKGKLPKDRLDRLTQIGFWTNTFSKRRRDTLGMKPDQAWEFRFNQLVEYKKNNDNAEVSREYVDNPGLGEWCHKQRKKFKKGELSEEKFQKLQEVGFVFKTRDWTEDKVQLNPDQLWEHRYNQLVEYRYEHGNCNVPQKSASNMPLARWVLTQRNLRKKGGMKKDREDRLSQLGFEWDRKGKSNVR